ncbi:MAG: right-handed parallel beta-helix repeat-containing protein, partial [Candidatus Marinimicrobia bacterium]|nr:right-handed parallel beta-helix repeat-containing protein [Candidatus Neomarinimicrobiota bacterium]
MTVDGLLNAIGTATDSIRFTTAEPGPSSGPWKRIYFTNTGPYSASVLEYCIVEYGGSGNTYAITMSSPSVKLQIGHSLIRRNSYGVYLLGSNASVSHSIIQEQTQYGIYGGGGATIQACTVTNNGSYGIYGQPASIEGCTVTNNGSHGIYLLSTSTGTSIKSTTIQGNSGHGLYLNQSSATVDSCTISGNSNTGINIRAYRSSIFSLTARRNVIYGNGDAGIVLYSASSTIEHNTIVGNGNGGITNIGSNSNVLIRNNIIANNTGNGLHTTVSPAPTTKFNDVFGNTTDYSGFSSLYGNYLTTNRNGDPADVYSNIGLDPVFVDPPGRDYHLQSTSHLIDAGDTLSTNDPDETIADIGAHFYNQSVAISLSTTLVEFGAVDIGTSQTGAFTVSASGAEDLIVSNITSNNPEFSASPTSFTVVPGGSQSVALTFLPSTVGEREALITVVNNSPIDPNKTLRATGFGVDTLAPAPPQNLTAVAGEGQVSLTWNQNTEPDFLRYRIYGGTAQNPTTSIDSTTSATDTTKTVSELTNDTIYYFRVTALNLGLRESAFSNEVNATPISPNQAPGVFFLIDPGDSTAIVITEVELMDTLRFRWSAAKDPDGDNVLYIATIDGRTIETSDTTIGIPYSVFTDSMQAIGETVSAGYWTVAATDGQNTTWAENGPFTFTIDISQIEVLPQITFIIDVPDDQGRQVYLNWSASGLDSPGGITQYSIKLLNPENSWVSLGTVTAEQDSAYTYLAATFGDSSAY